jgi:hypothetical protein
MPLLTKGEGRMSGNSIEQFSHKQGSIGSGKGPPATAKHYLSGNEDMEPRSNLQVAAANRRR